MNRNTTNYFIEKIFTSFQQVLFIIILITQINYSQWFQQSSGTTQHLRSVDFINPDFGICVGNEGTLLKTTDGGNNWQTKSSGTTNVLCSIDLLNANIGYAVGGNGIIIKTVNGGESWFSQISPDSSQLYSVFFFDELNGWIATQVGNVLKTTNGGNNWIKISTGYSSRLNSIFFTSLSTGFAVGNLEYILKTSNGGNNWTAINTGTVEGVYDVFFYSSLIGWATGTNGIVLKTVDSGENWQISNYSEPKQFLSIDFPTESKGWLGGIENEVLYSSDGGQNWINSTSSEYSVTSLVFLSDYLGWAVGENGVIMKYFDYHSLKVLYPNGGEALIIGTQDTIKWSSDNVDNIKIDYSIDDGNFWATIVNSFPANLGSYVWQVPGTPSENCIIRLTSVEDPSIYDKSDSVFSISTSSSISVLVPNGNEVWQIGATKNIIWTSSNVIDVKIELSINNGASWIEIISSTPSTGLYSWTVPNNSSLQCLIKISDVTDLNINDLSDNVFTIEQPSSMEDMFNSEIPSEFKLYQNFPNPFNPNTTIYYSIAEGSFVTLSIYNLLGEVILELVNEYNNPGNYRININFDNYNSGLYLYKLQAGSFVETKKMILLK